MCESRAVFWSVAVSYFLACFCGILAASAEWVVLELTAVLTIGDGRRNRAARLDLRTSSDLRFNAVRGGQHKRSKPQNLNNRKIPLYLPCQYRRTMNIFSTLSRSEHQPLLEPASGTCLTTSRVVVDRLDAPVVAMQMSPAISLSPLTERLRSRCISESIDWLARNGICTCELEHPVPIAASRSIAGGSAAAEEFASHSDVVIDPPGTVASVPSILDPADHVGRLLSSGEIMEADHRLQRAIRDHQGSEIDAGGRSGLRPWDWLLLSRVRLLTGDIAGCKSFNTQLLKATPQIRSGCVAPPDLIVCVQFALLLEGVIALQDRSFGEALDALMQAEEVGARSGCGVGSSRSIGRGLLLQAMIHLQRNDFSEAMHCFGAIRLLSDSDRHKCTNCLPFQEIPGGSRYGLMCSLQDGTQN